MKGVLVVLLLALCLLGTPVMAWGPQKVPVRITVSAINLCPQNLQVDGSLKKTGEDIPVTISILAVGRSDYPLVQKTIELRRFSLGPIVTWERTLKVSLVSPGRYLVILRDPSTYRVIQMKTLDIVEKPNSPLNLKVEFLLNYVVRR